MKYSALAISAILASAYARPDININGRLHPRDVQARRHAYLRPSWNTHLGRREVPQEHSHEKYLTIVGQFLIMDNPDGIVDPVFGLLGNAAGSAGQGSINDTDCLQQATADRAFTNAKAAGSVDGMTAALIYRALERNTGKVGLASVPCTAIQAVNPEIAAVQQHQDPSSENAIQINTNIAITLAIQIASIGGDPTLALQSGTFAPGDPSDPTAKGNGCDDQNDTEGCIFTLNLLVEDVSVDVIVAAVASAGVGGAVASDATATVIDTAVAAAYTAAPPAYTAAPPAYTVAPPAYNAAPPAYNDATPAYTAAPPAYNAAPPPPPPAECNVVTTVTVTVAAPPPPQANAMDTGVSPNTASPPVITALPPAAYQGDTTVDCSAQIASALAAAGMADMAANVSSAGDTATATATGVETVIVSPTPAASGGSSNAALDFGTCPNPTIIFADGLDGRQQKSFEPADTNAFTHGSALNIKVITDFICQQLGVKCGANQAALDACSQGAAAAQAEGGKDQGAADAFNSALGF